MVLLRICALCTIHNCSRWHATHGLQNCETAESLASARCLRKFISSLFRYCFCTFGSFYSCSHYNKQSHPCAKFGFVQFFITPLRIAAWSFVLFIKCFYFIVAAIFAVPCFCVQNRSVKFRHQFRLLFTVGCMNAARPLNQCVRMTCEEFCASCHCFVPFLSAAEEVVVATARSSKLFSGTIAAHFHTDTFA